MKMMRSSDLRVLDTDIVSLYQRGNPSVVQQIEIVGLVNITTTVVTVEEQISGWYTILRQSRTPSETVSAYNRLADVVEFFAPISVLRFTDGAFRRYQELQLLKLNIRKYDLRIAAIVLENNAVLITRNGRDFERIPKLQIENWAD